MFFTYLRRELMGRRKQTIIIAIGMALAIALVIIVNGVSLGVKNAQAKVLESVYGVGTDMTVTKTPTPPSAASAGERFKFGAGDGNISGTKQNVSTSRLTVGGFAGTLAATDLAIVQKVDGVKAAAATLKLDNVTFSGTLANQNRTIDVPMGPPPGMGGSSGGSTQVKVGPSGGADGAGGSQFDINRLSVIGVDPAGAIVGPLSTITLKDGKALSESDAGKYNAVIDSTYATNNKLTVGKTLDLGGKTFTIVGIVTNSTSDSSTSSDVYIPLDVAQTLSGNAGKVSTIYVQAADSTQIGAIQKTIQTQITTATVKTQSDLASSVSGSLGSAANLLDNLGLWLSIAVLVAAFLIAILFTVSGVTRRTREFGTLKAIGWRNGRITGQVAGESIVQGLIGGVFGIILGVVGLLIINVIHPVLTGSASSGGFGGFGGGRGPGGDAAQGAGQAAGQAAQAGFGGGMPPGVTQATTNVALEAPITLSVILLAVGLAIVGGLLAGAFGGWRASRLSPAEALRSVN